MSYIQVETKGLEKLLRILNINRAAGQDLIPACILSGIVKVRLISTMLTHIFKQTLATGELLKYCITANFIPIYKKGD